MTADSVDVTVDDDETASSGVTLTVSPESVSEGASSTPVTVTARLNGGTRGEATPVSVTVGSGTATSGTDFAAVTGFTITIAANSQSNTGTFTLTPTQDTVDEPDETVTVGGTTTVSGFVGDGDDGGDHGRRRLADGDAVAVGCVDRRGWRRHDGDGEPEPCLERGDDGDGVRESGFAGGGAVTMR